jgi:hypothetical protein
VTKAGQIQQMDQYGTTTLSGYDFDLGGEYKLTPVLLARAGVHFTRIGMSFKGDGAKSMRDVDPESDVTKARDSYFGIYLTAGYLF